MIANTLKQALAQKNKLLLTATPLQNSLLELFGLISFIDERAFGDLKSFREQFSNLNQDQALGILKARLKPICHRTLRRQVTAYVPFTQRFPILEEFTPEESEDRLYIHHASLPVAYRMYLPQVWSTDAARRRKAGVPEEIVFKTKPEIALEQIRGACEAGIARGVVLMDAGYGSDTRLRANLGALGLTYVAGIMPNTSVWMPGMAPLPPKKWSGQGRPPKLIRRDAKHRPISVKSLALGLPAKAWRTIRWREGSADWLSSRFARLRVRVAHRDYYLTESRAEEWLLIEWPKDESAPTKYWLASVADDIAFHRLVDLAKLRWRIERDYQDLKQEIGLGHYEGRGWRGFHHHATLCIAAYGFLISEREMIPPSETCSAAKLPMSAVPAHYRPRGAANPARTSHPELNRYHAATTNGRSRQETGTMPMLCKADQIEKIC